MEGFMWKQVKVWLHGAFMAAGAAFSAAVIQSSQSGVLPTTGQLKTDGILALCVGVSYLLKVAFLGSSSDTTPPAAVNVTKLLLVFVMISILSSCATWKSIKWSGNCSNTTCSICANIDSVKFVNQTEQQLLNTVKSALSTDFINNLLASYGLPNLGNINWVFSYSGGKVCLGATFNISKSFGGAAPLPMTTADKQKAVVSGMFKSLHK
jgi:hypothetical protein